MYSTQSEGPEGVHHIAAEIQGKGRNAYWLTSLFYTWSRSDLMRKAYSISSYDQQRLPSHPS